MQESTTYIYGLIPTGEEVIFDVAGMDDHHDRVFSAPHHDIAAVVGASPLLDYRGLKREEAVRYLVAHQGVLEAVMQRFPVLPVKFGTVLPDQTWVRRLLAQGENLFRATLERFAGLLQMEVVVLWNLEEVFQEIGQEEPIARLKAQVAAQPPAAAMMAERITIGQMVKASLERRRAELKTCLLPPLRELALGLVINPLMDERMVANVALLVDRSGREALDRRLSELDDKFQGRLRLRCVGPLPPYSFATVEVEVPSFEELERARCRLGLGKKITLREIRQAYRRMAGHLHPDLNPEAPEAQRHMAELTQAYQLLTAYAEGFAQGTVCYLDRPAVEGTLLIAIRRQGVLI